MAEKSNPLDGFKTVSTATNGFKIPPRPNLPELVKEHGLIQGLQVHHEQMEKHYEEFERSINERLQGNPPVSSGNV
jgi:hypothetical protein